MITAILVLQCFILFFLIATYGATNRLLNIANEFVNGYIYNLKRKWERENNQAWPDRENL